MINLETLAAGQGRYTAVRNHGGALNQGVPILNQSGWHDAGLVATLGGTTRLQYSPVHDGTDLRIVYVNGYNRSEGPNPITVEAAVEGPVIVGWNLPTLAKATWAGRSFVQIDPGGIAISDPIGWDVAVGTPLYIRTFATVASGGSLPKGSGVDTTRGESVVYSATAPVNYTTYDAQHLGAIMPVTGGAGYGPCAVLGTVFSPTTGPNGTPLVPVVGILGDSISSGSGDVSSPRPNAGRGFIRRGLNNQVAHINLGASGELAASMQQSATQWGRQLRAMMLDGCSHAIIEYGINDLIAGASTATIQSRLSELWASLDRRGMSVFQSTITPATSSSDVWATTTNQTQNANFPDVNRSSLNDWIRTTPAPLSGYLEAADLAESARNSGLWKPGYTLDGTHPNATGHSAIAGCVIPSSFVVF